MARVCQRSRRQLLLLTMMVAAPAVATSASGPAPAPASTAQAADCLLFEQLGPTDWALKPLRVRPGPIERTTRDVVMVTAATYRDLVALVLDADSPIGHGSATGKSMFQVTVAQTVGATAAQRVFVISAQSLRSVLERMRAMFDAEQRATPEFIDAIDRLLASEK